MTARPQHASPAKPKRVRVLRWALARDAIEQREPPKLDTFPPKVARPKGKRRRGMMSGGRAELPRRPT